MSHTPEPWILEDRVFEEDKFFIHEEGMRPIVASLYAGEDDDGRDGSHQARDDGKRIILCVNACAGLSNARLEGIIADMAKRAR